MRLMSIRREHEEETSWVEAMREFPANYFLFVDETRKDPRSLHRRYGRGLRGFEIPAYQDLVRGTSYSSLGVLGFEGMVDCCITNVRGVKVTVAFMRVGCYLSRAWAQPEPTLSSATLGRPFCGDGHRAYRTALPPVPRRALDRRHG